MCATCLGHPSVRILTTLWDRRAAQVVVTATPTLPLLLKTSKTLVELYISFVPGIREGDAQPPLPTAPTFSESNYFN